jgi:hypothetical protein
MEGAASSAQESGRIAGFPPLRWHARLLALEQDASATWFAEKPETPVLRPYERPIGRWINDQRTGWNAANVDQIVWIIRTPHDAAISGALAVRVASSRLFAVEALPFMFSDDRPDQGSNSRTDGRTPDYIVTAVASQSADDCSGPSSIGSTSTYVRLAGTESERQHHNRPSQPDQLHKFLSPSYPVGRDGREDY